MATTDGVRTAANLQPASGNATNTSRRYLSFAARAEAEGDPHWAGIFRAMASRLSGHVDDDGEVLEPTVNPIAKQVSHSGAIDFHQSRDLYPKSVHRRSASLRNDRPVK